jgi:hypothetical protein
MCGRYRRMSLRFLQRYAFSLPKIYFYIFMKFVLWSIDSFIIFGLFAKHWINLEKQKLFLVKFYSVAEVLLLATLQKLRGCFRWAVSGQSANLDWQLSATLLRDFMSKSFANLRAVLPTAVNRGLRLVALWPETVPRKPLGFDYKSFVMNTLSICDVGSSASSDVF